MRAERTAARCTGSHALIDNATILNACSALAHPDRINRLVLADLVSFIESLLLFDHLHTLVGTSFASGHRPTTLPQWDGRNPRNVYRALEGFRLLQPLTVEATWQTYRLEDLDALDTLARTLDIDAALAQAVTFYGADFPWREVTFGRGATGDDSTPIYCFEGAARSSSDEDRSPASRRRAPTDIFVSQTYYYLVASWLLRMPLTVSALRQALVDQLTPTVVTRYQGPDTDLLALVRSRSEKSAQFMRSAFPSQDFAFSLPPLLRHVLAACRDGPAELLTRVMEARDERRFRAFREWMARLTAAAAEGRLAELAQAAQQIDRLGGDDGLVGEPTRVVAKVLVNPLAALEELSAEGLGRVIDRLSRPHLLLLRDLGRPSMTDPVGVVELRRVFGISLDDIA